MHTRPSEGSFPQQIAAYLKLMDFDRYTIYRIHGNKHFKNEIEKAAALVDRLKDPQLKMDKESESQCASLSRQIGIYFAFSVSDHKTAEKYFANHRAIHDAANKLCADKEEAIALHGSMEAYTKNEVELADSWSLILYGQSIDGLTHRDLLERLSLHLKEYERLEKSDAHKTQLRDIHLGKALILNCLALKYNQLSVKPQNNTMELNQKAIVFLNEAIKIQKTYTELDPLILIDLAQSYYLLSVIHRNQFEFESAHNQIILADEMLQILKNTTHQINLLEFNVSQLHAEILRGLKKYAECITLVGEIIEDQKLYAGDQTNSSIMVSQQILQQVCNECVENALDYDWANYHTSSAYAEQIKNIQPAIIALIKMSDKLTEELNSKLAKKAYVLGTYLNHFANKPVMALECFLFAVEKVTDLYQLVKIKLEMVLSHQQIVCNIRSPSRQPKLDDNSFISNNMITSETLLQECETMLPRFGEREKMIRQEDITTLVTYLLYLRSLLEYRRSDLAYPQERENYLSKAADYAQKSFEHGKNIPNNLPVFAKCLYALLLSKIDLPPSDPLPIFQELEIYFSQKEQMQNSAAVDFFVSYAKHLYIHHKKNPDYVMIKNSLEKYKIAYDRLNNLEGTNTSPYSQDIFKQIEYLQKKLDSPTLTAQRNLLFSAESTAAASNDSKVAETSPAALTPAPSSKQ